MTTLARIAAEAYRTGLEKRGYYTSELDEASKEVLRDVLEATQESLDAVFKELDIWVHPNFPGWIGLPEGDEKYFSIRNRNVMEGMPMTRRLDDPREDEDYDEGFSAAYRAAHKPKRCEQVMSYGDVILLCCRERGHDGMHRALP